MRCLKLDQSLKEVKIKLISVRKSKINLNWTMSLKNNLYLFSIFKVLIDQNNYLLKNSFDHDFIDVNECSASHEINKLYSNNEMNLEIKNMKNNNESSLSSSSKLNKKFKSMDLDLKCNFTLLSSSFKMRRKEIGRYGFKIDYVFSRFHFISAIFSFTF